MLESLMASGTSPKHTILVITPPANDSIQQLIVFDDRLSRIADIKPPNPVPQIPKIELKRMIFIDDMLFITICKSTFF
jgi:hypothetical protein